MDKETRAFMESRFGHDFGRVRVHADGRAAESARAVNALAYTVGHHVVFGGGRYDPQSPSGRRLMAHELAHVVQQRGGAAVPQAKLAVSSAGSPAEKEADRAAEAVAGGAPFTPRVSEKPLIARRTACGADKWSYGEIRQWAIESLKKPTAPAGLADAKESIGRACSRNIHRRNCKCKDGSKATQPGDQAAWKNITGASGGADMTGGGNIMCVGRRICREMHRCGNFKTGREEERKTRLKISGQVTIKGHTLYFYNDPRNGACPPPPPKPKKKPKPKTAAPKTPAKSQKKPSKPAPPKGGKKAAGVSEMEPMEPEEMLAGGQWEAGYEEGEAEGEGEEEMA